MIDNKTKIYLKSQIQYSLLSTGSRCGGARTGGRQTANYGQSYDPVPARPPASPRVPPRPAVLLVSDGERGKSSDADWLENLLTSLRRTDQTATPSPTIMAGPHRDDSALKNVSQFTLLLKSKSWNINQKSVMKTSVSHKCVKSFISQIKIFWNHFPNEHEHIIDHQRPFIDPMVDGRVCLWYWSGPLAVSNYYINTTPDGKQEIMDHGCC